MQASYPQGDKRNVRGDGNGSSQGVRRPLSGAALQRRVEAGVAKALASIRPPVASALDFSEHVQAHQAHLEKLFPKGVPTDPDLRDAIVLIANEWESYSNDRAILRKITQEPDGNCPRAKRLESRIRKMRDVGKLNLPGRRERTKRTT